MVMTSASDGLMHSVWLLGCVQFD